MVRSATRLVLSLVIGLSAGSTLGFLFVPDPTSLLALVLVIGCATANTAFLYRSDWLRE